MTDAMTTRSAAAASTTISASELRARRKPVAEALQVSVALPLFAKQRTALDPARGAAALQAENPETGEKEVVFEALTAKQLKVRGRPSSPAACPQPPRLGAGADAGSRCAAPCCRAGRRHARCSCRRTGTRR